LKVQGSGFRVQGAGCRVQGEGLNLVHLEGVVLVFVRTHDAPPERLHLLMWGGRVSISGFGRESPFITIPA
jgi:hypothetical protein